LFRQALYEQQDLTAMAQKLSVQLSTDRKIMLGVQLYDLISQAGLKQEQVVQFYSFMSQLGMAGAGDRHRLSTETRARTPILRLPAWRVALWNRSRSVTMDSPT
jgi:hypothetical protein